MFIVVTVVVVVIFFVWAKEKAGILEYAVKSAIWSLIK
jgi:hypothetical protein